MTAPDRLPPACARRFHFERDLGVGAHGRVVLARQVTLDRLVAIKLLHQQDDSASMGMSAELRARLGNEARVTASLHHPHIVRVLDFEESDEVPWIAYEYLEGGPLSERLDGGPFPPEEALALALQVASALELAHQNGILHRDIKPANLIEVAPGNLKVADFGLVYVVSGSALTRTGYVVGTPAYLAPELLSDANHTPQTDLYALSITLYHMLLGRVPPIHERLIEAKMHQALEPLPAYLNELMRRLLARHAALRPPDARAMREELERARAIASGKVDPPPASGAVPTPATGPRRPDPQKTLPSRRRRRFRMWHAAAAVVVLGSIAVAGALLRPPATARPSSSSPPPSAEPLERQSSFQEIRRDLTLQMERSYHELAERRRVVELLPGVRSSTVSRPDEVIPGVERGIRLAIDLARVEDSASATLERALVLEACTHDVFDLVRTFEPGQRRGRLERGMEALIRALKPPRVHRPGWREVSELARDRFARVQISTPESDRAIAVNLDRLLGLARREPDAWRDRTPGLELEINLANRAGRTWLQSTRGVATPEALADLLYVIERVPAVLAHRRAQPGDAASCDRCIGWAIEAAETVLSAPSTEATARDRVRGVMKTVGEFLGAHPGAAVSADFRATLRRVLDGGR
jgi:serine/threonine protein kinase